MLFVSAANGNFTRISHEIVDHCKLIEIFDSQECDYRGQLHMFNVPENSFVIDVKYFHKHIAKNVAMLGNCRK